MISIDSALDPGRLRAPVDALFSLSASKLRSLRKSWSPSKGAPVFTRDGVYASRGWTEWTQGFLFGSSLLQFDATGEKEFLDAGRAGTVEQMAPHVSATGVHDHGFNNVSTYGSLHRMMREGLIPGEKAERDFCELALSVSGAVQASRWTDLGGGAGYICSFNGAHSLFADTIRSLRSLALAHQLGHILMGERDVKISLLGRLIRHAESTSRYNVYYGEGRDIYDVRGRVAHESIFNTKDGSYRCPSSQQGYSPFTTWTRGLAWIICGYAEEIEFIASLPEEPLEEYGGKRSVLDLFLRTAQATADFYIENTPTDGVPYWDTGAPGLALLGDYLERPADPFNGREPVDSSAAAIAAQGLIRLGVHLKSSGRVKDGERYFSAGLTVARTLFGEPYTSGSEAHQGLLLHSVYHRPNGWDHIARGRAVPSGESSMWGDYHARELALLLKRMAEARPYYRFFIV
ncbi:MAG TPA: glycosyl hydrolase [Bacteroidota bacterium]|nr:glycosyl hydrolase [Bacteroidota bacterium]